MRFLTFWGRYRKEQSFVQYPAKQHDVFKTRMEERYGEITRKPERKVEILAEQEEELATEATQKTSGGFWNRLFGGSARKKEETLVQRARWPAKK